MALKKWTRNAVKNVNTLLLNPNRLCANARSPVKRMFWKQFGKIATARFLKKFTYGAVDKKVNERIENVHQKNVSALREALIHAGKPTDDLMVYVDEFIAADTECAFDELMNGTLTTYIGSSDDEKIYGGWLKTHLAARTLLEKACRLGETDELMSKSAKVAAFLSPKARSEAISFGVFSVISSGSMTSRHFTETINSDPIQTLFSFWNEFLEIDDIYFLVNLILFSIENSEYIVANKGFVFEKNLFFSFSKIDIVATLKDLQSVMSFCYSIHDKFVIPQYTNEKCSEIRNINPDQEQLNENDIRSCLELFYWFGPVDFSRGGPTAAKNDMIIIKRNPTYSGNIHELAYVSQLVDNQSREAEEFLAACKIDLSDLGGGSAHHERIKSLNAAMESKFGTEGIKRFCESNCYIYSRSRPDTEKYRFWANFRTFLDIRIAVDLGVPFDIEHYNAKFRIISNAEGTKVAFENGVTLKFEQLTSGFRQEGHDLW